MQVRDVISVMQPDKIVLLVRQHVLDFVAAMSESKGRDTHLYEHKCSQYFF